MKHDKLALTLPWEQIEKGAQEQIEKALEVPCLKKLAIMPDVHLGYSLPIGGVALLEGHVSPAYVGNDIGCGMTAVITDLPYNVVNPEEVLNKLEREIPHGNGRQHRLPSFYKPFYGYTTMDETQMGLINNKLRHQCGTLGAGNHFIEIGVTNGGALSVVIHSGSRGAGFEVAKHFMNMAKATDDLLKEGTVECSEYIRAHNFMTEYALDNRRVMMDRVLNILGVKDHHVAGFINENHNQVDVTDDGWLHRKGATEAKEDQLGVIPGNMADGTYITRGRGNKAFLECASHGAGRVMGRKEAERTISVDAFEGQVQNIVCRTKGRLDEAPAAYKNVSTVVSRQVDNGQIWVIEKTLPKIVFKG